MHRPHNRSPRSTRHAVMAFAAVAGFATAALVGVAAARTFTVHMAHGATVMNTSGAKTHEAILVTTNDRAVYELSGDRRGHPKCTRANRCFQFWPPVKVGSARKLSKALGVKGQLGVWHRDGFDQVTLAGHPLYTYSGDSRKLVATGEGIKTFGGTWHVIAGSAAHGTTSTSPTSTSSTTTTAPTTTTMPTTTTTPCLYPPCY